MPDYLVIRPDKYKHIYSQQKSAPYWQMLLLHAFSLYEIATSDFLIFLFSKVRWKKKLHLSCPLPYSVVMWHLPYSVMIFKSLSSNVTFLSSNMTLLSHDVFTLLSGNVIFTLHSCNVTLTLLSHNVTFLPYSVVMWHLM